MKDTASASSGQSLPNAPRSGANGNDPRTKIALTVTWFSIITVGIIAIVIIAGSIRNNNMEGAKLVLTGVLPLLGTWVGTILAYYFSKENFEAAAQHERERIALTQETAPPKALAVARKLGKMTVARLPESKIFLSPQKGPFAGGNVKRLPVLDDQDHPHYIIHLNSILAFRENLTPEEIEALTLQSLGEKDNGLLTLFKNSFATIGETATIAEAKQKMDSTPKCQDIFITRDGTKNSPVLGWLTNARILEVLK